MELKRARVITFAMMFGVALFTGLATVLTRTGSITGVLPGNANVLLGAVFAVGLLVLATAPGLARKVASKSARPGPNAFFVEVVIRNAIREAVGLAGIVLGLLAVNTQWILAFGAACVLAMGLGWPAETELRDAERRALR